MATRRSQQKLKKNIDLEPNNDEAGPSTYQLNVSSDGDENERGDIKSEPDSNEESSGASGRGSPSHSLDVLAQVASETLQWEPISKGQPKKQISKRSVQSLDVLNLEQIRMLSDKALVNMFSDLNCDELRRQYTFQCFLEPKKCKESYTSFGNEMRARMQVKAHLLEHLGELLKEQGRSKIKFTAEPIQARKKRIAAEIAAFKRAQKKARMTRKAQPTYIPAKSPSRKRTTSEVSISGESSTEQDCVDLLSVSQISKKGVMNAQIVRRAKTPRNIKMITTGPNPPSVLVKSKPLKEKEDVMEVDIEGSPPRKGTPTNSEASESGQESSKRIEENEQLIIDLLARNQPYQDHNYTTVFGKKRGIEMFHIEMDSEDTESGGDKTSRTQGVRLKGLVYEQPGENDNQQAKTVTLRVNAGMIPTVNNVHIPIIRLARIPVAPDGTPLVSAEEVVVHDDGIEKIEGTSAHRPYPPMPKSDLAKKGRVAVPEEEVSSSDEDTTPKVMPVRRGGKKLLAEGSAEWERKLALKCIRELRVRKKEETSLVCKICKDKAFTATATLMYHYRSHAGIKPFVCLICNTTFTRQHSLNYHMLIHNNQSRFTCKDCGRKFRHPSHFKFHRCSKCHFNRKGCYCAREFSAPPDCSQMKLFQIHLDYKRLMFQKEGYFEKWCGHVIMKNSIKEDHCYHLEEKK